MFDKYIEAEFQTKDEYNEAMRNKEIKTMVRNQWMKRRNSGFKVVQSIDTFSIEGKLLNDYFNHLLIFDRCHRSYSP